MSYDLISIVAFLTPFQTTARFVYPLKQEIGTYPMYLLYKKVALTWN